MSKEPYPSGSCVCPSRGAARDARRLCDSRLLRLVAVFLAARQVVGANVLVLLLPLCSSRALLPRARQVCQTGWLDAGLEVRLSREGGLSHSQPTKPKPKR